MPTEPKLTKKQKKGIAFRERKGKSKAAPEEPADLPELEVQDEQESTIDAPASERDKLRELAVPERKSEGRKRKRTETGDGNRPPDGATPDPAQGVSRKKAKKRKADQGTKPKDAEDAEAIEEGGNVKAKKFILFVGECSSL
jgi:nucleolar protein 6